MWKKVFCSDKTKILCLASWSPFLTFILSLAGYPGISMRKIRPAASVVPDELSIKIYYFYKFSESLCMWVKLA
ncbi:hypothetical protein AMECASPLE_018338, partial [Ameca splendens]